MQKNGRFEFQEALKMCEALTGLSASFGSIRKQENLIFSPITPYNHGIIK